MVKLHLLATTALAVLLPLSPVIAIETNLLTCLEDGQFEIGVDYFPDKYIPTKYDPIFLPANQANLDDTTDYLEIDYFGYYKIVKNNFHNKSYLLYQCGAEPPQEEVNSGRHDLILPVPHKGGLAITQTPQIPPLELLGLREEIIAYIGDPQWVSSPCLRHRMDVDGSVEIVFDPEDPWNNDRTNELIAEFLQRNPEALIFTGPFSDGEGDRRIGAAASQERTNVATFDWIAMYAALYNLEGLSNQIAQETEDRYTCTSSNAQILSSDMAESERPTVLWANYFQGYNWSVAECRTWDESYYCEYAKHCGANIISRPEGLGFNDKSIGDFWYLNDEEMLALGKDAEIWIYPSNTWETVYESKKEILDQFKSVQNKQVYDTQGGGENMWYEQRLAEYDVVANDFCELVGLSNPYQVPRHTVKWFRNVYTDPIPGPGTCNVPDELDDRYVPVGAFCSPLAQTGGSGNGSGSGVSSLVCGQFIGIFVILALLL